MTPPPGPFARRPILLHIAALRFSDRLSNVSAMRRLFLIRHAKAEPGIGQNDYERALTERGRADARRIASALEARDLLPDVLIHSGALRTKQTAEIFAAQWPRRVHLQDELGLYDATRAMLIERVRALSDKTGSVGLVGHNPAIGEVATMLAGSGADPELRRMAAKYPTGAVAVIDFEIDRWDDVNRKAGLLTLFLIPGELEHATD
jgi:phosphohistidine phosphatase